MRALLACIAVSALSIGTAMAQNSPPASSGTDTTTGSSNNAVNPTGNMTSTVNASGTVDVVAPSALEKGANSFTESQARSRIEGAGFTAVTDLHKDDSGVWRGKATRGGKSMEVGFDYKGNISAQ